MHHRRASAPRRASNGAAADQQLEASVRRPSAASRHRRPRTDGAISCLESMATFSSRPRPPSPRGAQAFIVLRFSRPMTSSISWKKSHGSSAERRRSRRRSLQSRHESERHRTWWNRSESVKEIWGKRCVAALARCRSRYPPTSAARVRIGCV
jgi:hypothetical protein